MQPNPYEPPRQPLPRKGSVGVTLIRIGGILAAIGVAAFINSWIAFYQLFDGQPQSGIQLLALVALALIPVGMLVACVGIVRWSIERPNS